jgi:ABC-type polysaccharide/polyol phosphate transport system ATPase subunit
MQSYQEQGSTVLIVSHGLAKIQDMCNRVLWLDHGQVQMIGDPAEVIEAYRRSNQ